MNDFNHISPEGNVRMVDVSKKKPTAREAKAKGVISMNKDTMEKLLQNVIEKGNVLETARIAGIMAAKKTSELIPMCHPMNLTHVEINLFPDIEYTQVMIEATVRVFHSTGVEMEALTAVSVAALTIYDMCKSYDKGMTISDIRLMKKSGGKSGDFVRE